MIETFGLASGVPLVLAAVWLLGRRGRWCVSADVRGIALQTVIIIVVMLVIAGGVAGVLLSRSSEVITDLEAQDITRAVDTAAECEHVAERLTDAANDGVFTTAADGTHTCVVTSDATADGAGEDDRFTNTACLRETGEFSGMPRGGGTGASICTITT